VQNADICIVHSLAVFKMRDCSSTINTGHAPRRAILQPRRNGIETDDPAYYSVAMAMGKRRRRAKQTSMWMATEDLPRTAAHPFYTRLNHILEKHDLDEYVEGLCERSYEGAGRPGLPPGRYFRLLLIGYSKGGTQRGGFLCAARVSRTGIGGGAADHSTISRTRRLIDLEAHETVFTWT
jgi:hypothetical protein